jgi:phosphatidylserine decarboxylase
MVRDGYYYGGFLIGAAFLLGWLTSPAWAIPCLVLASFFLWFFRDPERNISQTPGSIVSPADGKVTDVSLVQAEGRDWKRISIFLNIFDVHVNRSPISGVIRTVRYQEGKFLNAMNEACAELNEQNTVAVEGEGQILIFKQIAGLLARRIVFTKKVGDTVARGERVGLIKFGSRTDLLLGPEAEILIKKGDRVKGGATVVASLHPKQPQLVGSGAQQRTEGAR